MNLLHLLKIKIKMSNIYSRFHTLSKSKGTNHDSHKHNGMYYIVVYINNENIEQQRLVISK